MEKEAKKKILYLITKSVWAGAGKYVYDLAANLDRKKFEVFAAAGGRGPLAEKLARAGVKYFEIKNFQRDVSFAKDILTFFEVFFLLIKIKPDIIHASSPKAGGIGGIALVFYKLFLKIKNLPAGRQVIKSKIISLYTAHGWTFNEPRPQWQAALIKFFSKLTCLFYERIICVSEYDRQSAVKNKIAPPKKLLVIHNGIRPEDYDFLPKEEARKFLGKRIGKDLRDSFIIGTIGEFTKNKGQKFLIRAAQKISESRPETICLIIGFDGGEKENLLAEIKKLKMKNSIFLVEDLPEAAKYLKAFDIFALPSLKEGLPYVLLEAGLAELAVAAASAGGVPEIIEDSKTGLLVPPADSQTLAAALLRLAEDESLRKNLAENLHQKILGEFSFKNMQEKTIGLYLS